MFRPLKMQVHFWCCIRSRSWMRHCGTSRKVAGSISDGVFEICHCLQSSGCTVAVGPTQSLTDASTRDAPWVSGEGGPCVGPTTLSPCADWNPWEPGISTSWSCRSLCLCIPFTLVKGGRVVHTLLGFPAVPVENEKGKGKVRPRTGHKGPQGK